MRIHWRDFVGTMTYRIVQSVLEMAGYRMVVVLDENKVATDVYIALSLPTV
jgi:hypothetical protein